MHMLEVLRFVIPLKKPLGRCPLLKDGCPVLAVPTVSPDMCERLLANVTASELMKQVEREQELSASAANVAQDMGDATNIDVERSEAVGVVALKGPKTFFDARDAFIQECYKICPTLDFGHGLCDLLMYGHMKGCVTLDSAKRGGDQKKRVIRKLTLVRKLVKLHLYSTARTLVARASDPDFEPGMARGAPMGTYKAQHPHVRLPGYHAM